MEYSDEDSDAPKQERKEKNKKEPVDNDKYSKL